MKRGVAAFLMILVVVALLPLQIRCGSSSGNAEPQVATQAEEPGLVQISHTIPSQVTLLDMPFIAEFILEMPAGSSGDIAYHVIQASDPVATYLPEGITYKEVLVDPNLKENGSVTLLMVAANNDGCITRLEVDVILNTDCPGCDLSCKELSSSGNRYSCTTYYGVDFSGANLSGVNFRGQNLMENDFSYANLTYADMSSDLETEPYVITTLNGCDFRGADLLGADLSGRPFTRAKWAGARCPDGTYADDHGQTCYGYGAELPE